MGADFGGAASSRSAAARRAVEEDAAFCSFRPARPPRLAIDTPFAPAAEAGRVLAAAAAAAALSPAERPGDDDVRAIEGFSEEVVVAEIPFVPPRLRSAGVDVCDRDIPAAAVVLATVRLSRLRESDETAQLVQPPSEEPAGVDVPDLPAAGVRAADEVGIRGAVAG